MAANTGLLAGRTLFITGASRGIGKAIALKAARDGANVVIAAKTAEPNPKLRGTIYTAAKEVEAAGGQCLPCVVDIRSEEQVQSAVSAAVKQFGGIDILVNNASAISLTGTAATSMKKYDLMNGVNARGTYLCSQACLPHLKASKNPHILTLCPPLNMQAMWFSGHVAYTIAKYGMSMCVLGMAEEFKSEGIAVNALWPKTAILTAAMEMIGGVDIADKCRTPDIMADSAYLILTKDSKSFTGNFVVDEEFLVKEGITYMDQYAVKPGEKLIPDFFLNLDPNDPFMDHQMLHTPSTGQSASSAVTGSVAKMIPVINSVLTEDLVASINGIFKFNIKGVEEGEWFLDLKSGQGSFSGVTPAADVNCTVSLDSGDFVKMFQGDLKPTAAFMAGKLKIKGDMGLAMKLEKVMVSVKSKL